MTSASDDADAVWLHHRSRLLRVAYGVLGTWSDAEDVVQDAWLRWRRAGPATIADPEAWLVTVTTRLALDHLRRAYVQRETYVGPWLPEPVVDDDPAEASATADSVSFALLTVLESLSPLERTVFILRDAFAYPYPEIAGILERSEPAVRQLARRARAHVRDRSPRYDVDLDMQRDVTQRFLDASIGGRLDELLTLLAPDVELVSDTGGIVRAPRRVVVGSDKVARFVVAVAQEPGLYTEFARINGEVGILIRDDDATVRYVGITHIVQGRIQTVSLIANPDKLTQINRMSG
jgi:RNA polymerase sigma-70 factor (ECF subfamily)